MYSVIDTNGFQQKVSLGEKIKVPLVPNEAGKETIFSKVLLFSDGQSIEVGSPTIKDAQVKGEILEHGRYDKVKVFKKKRRQNYRWTLGHKQDYTLIRITEIACGGKVIKADAPAKAKATSKTKEK